MKNLFWLLSLILLSCSGEVEDVQETISSRFDSPFPGRTKNLQRILGNEFRLKSDTDTIHYIVRFDRKTRYNYIIDAAWDDTIFAGTICRDRDLFYFNELRDDSCYYISAVRIDHYTVTGLWTSFEQMHEWDDKFDYLLDNPAEVKNEKSKILKSVDTLHQRIYLTPTDKKEMALFYKKLLSDMQPDSIVRFKNNTLPDSIREPGVQVKDHNNADSTNGMFLSLHPNPASTHLDIILSYGYPCPYAIYNINGQLESFGEFYGSQSIIDLSGYLPGRYFLQAAPGDTGTMEVTSFIIE